MSSFGKINKLIIIIRVVALLLLNFFNSHHRTDVSPMRPLSSLGTSPCFSVRHPQQEQIQRVPTAAPVWLNWMTC